MKHHRRRFDGTGLPDALSNTAIPPLEAHREH
ncbi:hypothetical protein O9929_21325 [Vibrio lentus]|nr:hypothetical protein [Vibrio lentus]